MFSSAVSIGSRLKNWNTNPMWSRRSLVRSLSDRLVISIPSIETDPEVGLSSPARMCISVDLPDPDGPITAVSRARCTVTETSSSAVTAVSPSPKRRVTSVATSTASDLISGASGSLMATARPYIHFRWCARPRC